MNPPLFQNEIRLGHRSLDKVIGTSEMGEDEMEATVYQPSPETQLGTRRWVFFGLDGSGYRP